MAPATFGALPVELIEIIVSHIDLPDICSLRLVCRALANNASSGRFRTFFQRKNIYITTSSLEDLARITSPGRYGCHLACLLQECTLVGLLEEKQVEFKMKEKYGKFAPPSLPTTAEELDKVARQTKLLTEIFNNIKEVRSGGDKNRHVYLESLTLRVSVRQEDGTLHNTDKMVVLALPIWDMAQRTFQMAMDALLASQLRVRTCLDIFHSQMRCSLSSCFFSDVLREKMNETTRASLVSVFSSLKHLAISLSGPHCISGPRSVTRDSHCRNNRDLLAHEQHSYFMEAFQTVLDLAAIGSLSELKVLDIHWFEMSPYELGKEKKTERDFSIPLAPKLAPGTVIHLDSCNLTGVRFATEDGLVQVLQVLQPRHVTLYETYFPRSACDVVFGYLADPDSPVKSYHLDDMNYFRDVLNLGEFRDGRIHLFGPAKRKYPCQRWPRTLIRDGAEAKTAIVYELIATRTAASGPLLNWNAERYKILGPLHTCELE